MADRRSKRRKGVAARERRARALEADLADARQLLASLRSIDPAGDQARNAEARVARLEQQRRSAIRKAREARQQAEKEEQEEPPPPARVEDLDRDLPLLLLPVRLETRFFRQPDETWELRVRIYPDEIHVDGHEEELTASEIRWGRHFWEQVWKWQNDEARTNAAWRQLVDRFGGPRTAWIASKLKPRGFDPRLLLRPFKTGSAGPPPLRFPNVRRRGTTWSRPARAGMLPDYWGLWGWTDGYPTITASGGPVNPDLAVGPDPAALGEPGRDPEPIDEGMRWMVDFDKALTAGMAIRTNIGAQDRVDTLIVFGLRGGDPPELSQELSRHVQTLRFGRGLDFVRQGAPTNNTDAVRSGWDAGADDDASVQGMLRLLGPLPRRLPDDNATTTSYALWLPSATFARLPRARETEQHDARRINDLLWATTWGQYLTEMIGGGIIPPSGIAWVREHWANYVRGRGPLPIWRVANQPYGVLPVLCGEAEDPRTPEEYLEVVLRTARSIWNESIPEVTRLRLDSPDSDRDLVQALATLPHPTRFAVRGVVARSILRTVALGMSDPWNGWQFDFTGVRSFLTDLFAALGVTGHAHVLDVVYTDGSREWVTDLVTAKGPSDTEPLQGNYLEWMGRSGRGSLRNENHPYEKNTLLYVLARRSGQMEDSGSVGTPAPRRFRAAARHLAQLPTATLEQLLRETLGTCAYRLDAWETSLAARQIVTMRTRVEADPLRRGGIQIGGYGWVEDLRAREPLSDPEPEGPDPSRGPPVDPENSGFVHAPSLQHATTASILRSAWLSHGAAAHTPMAVDLSSARARDASELLEGVRNGLGLGELLGYRFERGLHEGHPGTELDQYIDDFRELAPLQAGKQPGTEAPGARAAEQAAPAVVDGLRLLELWRTADAELTTLLDAIGSAGTDARLALEDELRALAQAVDAVSDSAMAEGVHQLLQGNQARSGAITEAVSTGELPPPELEVHSPSRTGRGVTHRLVLPLESNSPVESGWPGAGTAPRARTEPRLENWLASLLPDPERIVAQVGYLPPGGESPIGLRTFYLKELGLSALDAVILAPGQKADAGELGARFAWLLLRERPAEVPEGSRPWVDADWSEKPVPEQIPLADFLMLARTLRHAVAEARPLRASDLAVPADGIDRNVDLEELLQRSNGLVAELRDTLRELESVADSAPAEQVVEPLREALLTISNLGVPGAVPRSVAGSGEAEAAVLLAQRAAVAARVQARLEQAGDDASAADAVDAASPQEAETLLTARIRAVLGKGFPVLPQFTAPNAPALAATFGDSDALQRGDPFASIAWLERAARVQPRAATFLRAMQFAESLSDRTHLALRVGQLPFGAGEVWAALSHDLAEAPRGGGLSLVAQTFGDHAFDGQLQGLVLDEWAEVIPGARQTTGVTFHYDAPGSRAPQSMLLLTLFDTEPAWTEGLVQNGLRSSMDRMRLRLADSNALVDGGHLLPAVFLRTDAVSAQLAGDLGRGLVGDDDSVVVDQDRPAIDIDIGPPSP